MSKKSRIAIAKSIGLEIPEGVAIRPVSMVDMMGISESIRERYREEGQPIEPPTYKVPIGVPEEGEEQEYQEHQHFYNEKTEDTSLETDADFQAWEEHQRALSKMENETIFRTMQYMLEEGIEVDWTKFDGWEKRKERYGIRIPEDEYEKKMYFITSTIFPTPGEQKLVSQYIMTISMEGADPDRIAAIEELFRSKVEEGQG